MPGHYPQVTVTVDWSRIYKNNSRNSTRQKKKKKKKRRTPLMEIAKKVKRLLETEIKQE